MDVSRSGRVRKKSSKLADFESPDDIELRQGSVVKKRIREGEYTPRNLSSLVVDDLPPDQLLADDTTSDIDSDDIFDIKEEDFDEIPLLKGEQLGDVDDKHIGTRDRIPEVSSPTQQSYSQSANPNLLDGDIDSDDEGNLLIDDSRGRSIKRSKIRTEKSTLSKKSRKETSGKLKVTPFLLWAKTARPKLEEESSGKDFGSLKTRLGEMWMNLPDTEKYNWKRRAQRFSFRSSETEIQQQGLSQYKASGSGLVGNSPILAAAISGAKLKDPAISSNMYKVTGTEPIDAAAHLKLLGESLSTIGERLCEHEGQIAVSGSLSVLLDSLLCATAPLLCLTQQVPELNGIPQDTLKDILDNIAYIMPGL